MPASLDLLPKFAPIVARHFSAYLDLFADDAAELGTHMAKRMIATLAAMLAFSFALAMGCVWILAALWDTPWRYYGIAALFTLFAIATAVAWFTASRPPQVEWSPFQRLRAEWVLDEQLIAELMQGSEGSATAAERKTARSTVSQSSARSSATSQPVKDYAT